MKGTEKKESTRQIKEERLSISELLKDLPDEIKYRWCESQMCACVGAANCVGKLTDNLYSKEDWLIWKEENPQKEYPLYKVEGIIPENKRIEVIRVIRDFLNIGVKDVQNFINDKKFDFALDYDDQEESFILSDIYKLKTFFDNINVNANIVKTKRENIFVLPFVFIREE